MPVRILCCQIAEKLLPDSARHIPEKPSIPSAAVTAKKGSRISVCRDGPYGSCLQGTMHHHVSSTNPKKIPRKRVFLSGPVKKFTIPKRNRPKSPTEKILKKGSACGKKPVLASKITKRFPR